MKHDASEDALRIIETDQGEDTDVRVSFGEQATARLVSRRCRESQEQALPGQDYAVVISNADGASISLCVCDGVGSSYKGNFAAQYLAGCMVAWLQKLPVVPQQSAKAIRPLRSRLRHWAHDAQQTLIDFAIPSDAPELVREVLEELRQAHGSETVFFCGRVDLVRSERGRAARPALGIFLWMGNVAAQLFTTGGRVIDLGEKENDAARWSTARGQRGLLTARSFRLERVDRLLVYTDGLRAISDTLAALDEDELDAKMRYLLEQPDNDDMTVLDIRWGLPHLEADPGKED